MNDLDDIYGGHTAKAVGARLELVRQVNGLSQKDFATRAGLGVTTYGNIETGTNYPSVRNAHALCHTYQIDFNWIFLGDPSSLKYELGDLLYKTHQLRQRTGST